MGYEWMPGLMAILRGVEPHEVVQALENPRRWPRPVCGPHGLVYLAIHARSNAGRPFTIVIRPTGGHDSTIVAARPMTPAELAQFESWERPS